LNILYFFRERIAGIIRLFLSARIMSYKVIGVQIKTDARKT